MRRVIACYTNVKAFGDETYGIIVDVERKTHIGCLDNEAGTQSFQLVLDECEDEDLLSLAVSDEIRQWLVGERNIGLLWAMLHKMVSS